jgi:3-methylfumaryl-CoA hydratase
MTDTEPTRDPAVLARWIGRRRRRADTIRLQPAHFMEMTLDREPMLAEGDPLPPLWHWLSFLETAPLSRLGRDGHPARGDFLPPVALPRRMWAGGRLTFHAPLAIGAGAERVSTIADVAVKEGRTGPLCFVTVRHEISAGGRLRLTEEHDIVYREDPAPGAPRPAPAPVPEGLDRRETVTPSEVMLFRYSALTFNGHRIHYDRAYAREVEGHDGLVFHGPLTATLLADLAVRMGEGRALAGFAFRATSPLHEAPFTIAGGFDGEGVRLAAISAEGRLAMTAEAAFA